MMRMAALLKINAFQVRSNWISSGLTPRLLSMGDARKRLKNCRVCKRAVSKLNVFGHSIISERLREWSTARVLECNRERSWKDLEIFHTSLSR